eukprot:3528675-Karenia_brevis.AAC.1
MESVLDPHADPMWARTFAYSLLHMDPLKPHTGVLSVLKRITALAMQANVPPCPFSRIRLKC